MIKKKIMWLCNSLFKKKHIQYVEIICGCDEAQVWTLFKVWTLFIFRDWREVEKKIGN